MSLWTSRDGCASRRTRPIADRGQGGFFLIEVLVLSFIVLACGAAVMTYRVLDRARAASEAELAAACLAQEQLARIEAQPASYLRAHEDIPWLGGGGTPPEMNHVAYEVSSRVVPNAETASLAAAEVRVSWSVDGRSREATFRKLVAYHD